MQIVTKKPTIKTFQAWVYDARVVSREWRAESWRDHQMYDGGKAQWDEKDWNEAIAAGITPVTINRTFPTVNLILGVEAFNKRDIICKARTHKDGELSQIMSEGLKFVLDQNGGEWLVSQAFNNQVVPGFGVLSVGLNHDPRKERIKVGYRDWKEMHYDPFGSPWMEPDNCRYVFHQKWMDLDELQALFPEKRKDLEDHFFELVDNDLRYGDDYGDDYADQIEEYRQQLIGSDWADRQRHRVRPVELWYTIWAKSFFCRFRDGRVAELRDDLPAMDQLAMVQEASEVLSAIVKRMRVTTFLGNLILQDTETPFSHDQFPFIPFIGYLDRFGMPYGLPKQIRGQDEEVNKRRSMALALLKARRVIAEEDVVSGGKEALQELYEEANKLDGFLVIRPGKRQGIEIVEQAQLSQPQIALLEQSEREIQEITGSNNDRMGLQTNAVSGAAIQNRQEQGSLMSATLFDNLRRSTHRLGEQIVSCIQDFWTGEKVLRVTDRVSGAERFVVLNEQKMLPSGGYEIRNNITQGRYDLVVSETQRADTVREKNMEMIIEWVKKSPPEVIPHLMALAFELSNIPNKDQVMARIKPILGIDPSEEDMSPEQLREKAIAQIRANQEAAARQNQIANEAAQLDLAAKQLENQKTHAETLEIMERVKVEKANTVSKMGVDHAKAKATEENVKITGYRAETERIGKAAELEQRRTESNQKFQQELNDTARDERRDAIAARKAS